MHFVREFTPELSIEAKKAEKKAGKKKKRNQSAQSEASRSGAGIMLFSRGVHIFVPRKARERNPLGKGAAAVAN